MIVTGFDEKSVFYHESGPGPQTSPNRKVSKKSFIKAWNAKGTDNDCVVVYGKL